MAILPDRREPRPSAVSRTSHDKIQVGEQVDAALLTRVDHRDASTAFEIVCRHESSLILPLAQRILGNEADAQDLKSELLLRLLQAEEHRRSGNWPPKSVRRWLTTVVTRLALDMKRSRDAERHRRRRQTAWFDSPPDPAVEAESRSLREEVRRALNSLPPLERQALELLELRDLTAAAASKELRVSTATLYRYRAKALKRLGTNMNLRRAIWNAEVELPADDAWGETLSKPVPSSAADG